MKNPLISVIVPIYNVEKFLPYSMESILNQTYSNLEIILVNDGSTDKSKSICEMYQSKDKRIKLINQKNQGVSVVRNIGIANATGEYIGFIDSDDRVSFEFYEQLYKLIKETDSDIAECASVQISEEDLFNHKYKFDSAEELSYIVTDSIGALNRIHNEDRYIVGKSLVVWNKLYRRTLFENLQFPIGKRYEDDFTTYKIFNKINRFVSTEKVLYNYVQRKDSIMHQKFSLKRLDALEAFDNHVEFFKDFPDKYLFCKCLVRYLRILTTILEELYESDCDDKQNIKKILKNKFEEISFLLDSNKDKLDSKQSKYICESETLYNEKFYDILKNNL